MAEEIRPDLFRIRIPLPDSPLKYLNSYVIRSADRNLIIDTGLNRTECLEAMTAGLDELGIDRSKTDIFITHLHADHFGLVGRVAVDGCRVFFNRPDMEIIETWEGFEPMIAYAGANGFPEHQLREALNQHPGAKFASDWIPPISVLKDGDPMVVGDYRFRCISTPGHTLGHMCLYEPDKKLLIAGDHILIDITPNIQCWSDGENPLHHYLSSLDKVRRMDVALVLPGHRRLFEDHRARIDELKIHHRHRLDEILTILENGPQHAFTVASQMTWDLDAPDWEAFPVAQKWFATGEALSHLRYLEDAGNITRGENQSRVSFALKT